MRICAAAVISAFFLLSSTLSVSAQQSSTVNRDQIIAEALYAFAREESRKQLISKALEDLELSMNTLVTDDERSLDERDLKIKQALERLESAQITVPDDFSDGDFEPDPENIPSRPPIVIRGQLRNEVAARMYTSSQITKFKNQLQLTATGELIPSVRYRVSGRALPRRRLRSLCHCGRAVPDGHPRSPARRGHGARPLHPRVRRQPRHRLQPDGRRLPRRRRRARRPCPRRHAVPPGLRRRLRPRLRAVGRALRRRPRCRARFCRRRAAA